MKIFIQHGMTALMIAAENGHSDIVKALIRAGANTDVKNDVCY